MLLAGSSSLWLHDWAAYTPVYNWEPLTSNVPAGSWVTLINITGKGALTFARAFLTADNNANSGFPDIRVTVDGAAYTFLGVSSSSLTYGNMITTPVTFTQSLKIELYNPGIYSAVLGFDYTYLLHQATPDATTASVLAASQRLMVSGTAGGSTSLIDLLNVTGSGYLLQVDQVASYSTAAKLGYLDVTVDGVKRMNDRAVTSSHYAAGYQKLGLFVGPIRFNTSLVIQTRQSGSGSTFYNRVFYTLD